ncbi:MAG: CopG family ribbon-helix-helix protein [Burkholderiales bacterium]|jgi:predicted transcriptional regulator
MAIRLEDDLMDRLECLADSSQRSRSLLAVEAIREYVEANEWQLVEIKAALREADAGRFATDAEVAAVALKWRWGAG